METAAKQIVLVGSESYIPDEANDSYRVLSGSVLIYIVPWKNGMAGRRLLLCEAEKGQVIPSFVYRDLNYEGWRFCFIAKEHAELLHMPNCVTSVLLRNFAKYAGLNAYATEGFEQSLVEFYHRETLKDNVFISRGKENAPRVNIASYGVIHKTFMPGQDVDHDADPVYRAVAFACKASSIPIEPYDQIVSKVGKDVTAASIASASRFVCRKVVLEPGWYRNDCGSIISTINKEPVACVPRGSSYEIFFAKTGERKKMTGKLAEQVDPCAESICRALPDGKLTKKDLFRFGGRSLSRGDLTAVILLGIVGALIGVLLPMLNQKVYDDYILLGNYSQLIQLCLVICTFMIGNLFFNIVKTLSEFRLRSRIGYDMQNAVYHRLFRLPESFFRSFDSADLAQRLGKVSDMVGVVVNTTVLSALSLIFSLIYLIRMFQYSSNLALVSLVMIAVYGLIMYWLSIKMQKYEKSISESSGEASSRLYQYLNGIEKIRMAGVEDQAVYEYLVPYAKKQKDEIRKNRLDGVRTSLGAVVSSIFSMVLYYIMVGSNISVSMGEFVAFNTAFGSFSGAFLELVDGLIQVYQLKPSYERIRPVFETVPEDGGNHEAPGELSGMVSLEHVTFAYDEKSRKVLNDLSLQIHAGEYLGIVGPSGCGKSTLLKMLLGFEQPQTGQVLYDGHDLKGIDKRKLRRNLGVVLQNGKLIAGSIYENITITSPHATMKDVQAVIEAVGLKEDIDRMPMGIHTVLSENSGTISGGQQQRILIARAIISHPSILIFDEATSALDNLTQAAVCKSLDNMNVTRIVVAHRLSTIRNCDRIVVLENGNIAEEGNYASLMQQRGLFYRLASRQLAE